MRRRVEQRGRRATLQKSSGRGNRSTRRALQSTLPETPPAESTLPETPPAGDTTGRTSAKTTRPEKKPEERLAWNLEVSQKEQYFGK